MANEPIPYRKIGGTGSGIFEYTSLYAGPDHLLQVTSTGYRESYRRFYFRDIQSITMRESASGKVMNGIYGGLMLLCLIATLQGGAFLIGWSIPAGIFLLLLIINLLRGPTCVSQIQTAVQLRKLGSLKRLRQARKFLDQLRPEIEAAQGALPPGEIVRRLEQIRQGGFDSPREIPPASSAGSWDAAGGFR